MKHLFLLTPFVFLGLFGQAQSTTSDSLKPTAREKQFTFAINNNSGFFAFKKYRTPTLAYRFGFSGNYAVNHNNYSNDQLIYSQTGFDSVSHNFSTSSNSLFSLNLFLGFQKSFGTYKHFEPYAGVDLSVGNRFQNGKSETTNNPGPYSSSSKYIVQTNTETHNNVIPTVSLLPFIGFNYYLAERFALGAEYRLAIVSMSFSKDQKTTTTYHFSDGSTTSLDSPNTISNTNITGSFSGSAYITATFFLTKSKAK
jgi:hypothetical protein